MSVEVMSAPLSLSQPADPPLDDAQYADYLRFKQFQSLVSSNATSSASNSAVHSRSNTPSLYDAQQQPTTNHTATATHTATNGHRTHYGHSRSYDDDDSGDEPFKGYLSKQYRTIGNPAPLGLCAFALTTWVLSMYNVGAWVPSDGPDQVVMGAALAYGGLVQLLAGMWEMWLGNTFAALAFSSYGGFWIGTASLYIRSFGFLDYYAGTDALSNALGVYYMGWLLFTFMMLIASHRTSIALFLLFFFLTITFLLLTIAQFTINRTVHQAAGAFGIITATIAWYAAFAGLLDRRQQSLFRLPVGDLRAMFPTREERDLDRARRARREQRQRALERRTMAEKQV